MTVNAALEVESAEWRDLDVLRWQALAIELGGVEDEAEALPIIRAALADAIEKADDRLIAARINLTGATALHGVLHRDIRHWRAQVLAIAQDFGEDAVWIERVRIETTPIYDLAQLAERDALTKTVLETLEAATSGLATLPADLTEMLDVLPQEVRTDVEEDWAPELYPALMEEVRAIVLEALQTKGGTSE